MRVRRWLCVGLGLLALLTPTIPAAAEPPSGTRLFALADARIGEASGLAIGHRSPSVLYLQNDSGDSARFFAVDARTGLTRTVCTVLGARNVDWEDLATAPDGRGVPSVWLADIGDNHAQRESIQLYRVDEPAIGTAAGEPATISTGPADRITLRYPDGAHDAEALVADPVTHRLYLMTKSVFGQSEVFAVPAATAAATVRTLVRVGTLTLGLTGTPGGPNVIGQLTVTGASIAADGALLVARSYTDAYLWPVVGGDVTAALRSTPTRIPLPAQPQGEGIAIAGDGSLLIDSEGVGSAVYRVPVPASVRRSAATATPRLSAVGPPTAAVPVASSPAAEHRLSAVTGWEWLPVLALILLLLVAGAVLILVLRARSTRRRN